MVRRDIVLDTAGQRTRCNDKESRKGKTKKRQKLHNAIFLYSVLQNSYEKSIKTDNFALGVAKLVFFVKGILFSNFYAVAVKMRPRLENWSKYIFVKYI